MNSSATRRLSAPDLYCRVDGRMYRLSRAADKTLEVWRVQAMQDAAGRRIGRYQGRPDATKAVDQVADQREQRRSHARRRGAYHNEERF
jgi:hypothetical protein